MSEEDKQTFNQGRPYVVGAVALAVILARPKAHLSQTPVEIAFDEAEAFVAEFEKRNGIA